MEKEGKQYCGQTCGTQEDCDETIVSKEIIVSNETIVSLETRPFPENGIGNYLKMARESRGYAQKEICDGICSLATFSRMEAGEKIVDFLMIEAFLSRMKLERSECEFFLDDADYFAYKQREEIEALVRKREYGRAEEKLAAYAGSCGTEKLHGQFLNFQHGLLERTASRPDPEKARGFFLKALAATAPDYQEKFKRREILSNLELRCIVELIYWTQDSREREEKYDELYSYFVWSCRREGIFPAPYRAAMQYYAECLYENGKYEKCISICDEALKELRGTSKLENRGELFLVRARAKEARGGADEEERRCCLKDYLTAYSVFAFFDGEDSKTAGEIRKRMEEKYKWPSID